MKPLIYIKTADIFYIHDFMYDSNRKLNLAHDNYFSLYLKNIEAHKNYEKAKADVKDTFESYIKNKTDENKVLYKEALRICSSFKNELKFWDKMTTLFDRHIKNVQERYYKRFIKRWYDGYFLKSFVCYSSVFQKLIEFNSNSLEPPIYDFKYDYHGNYKWGKEANKELAEARKNFKKESIENV